MASSCLELTLETTESLTYTGPLLTVHTRTPSTLVVPLKSNVCFIFQSIRQGLLHNTLLTRRRTLHKHFTARELRAKPSLISMLKIIPDR